LQKLLLSPQVREYTFGGYLPPGFVKQKSPLQVVSTHLLVISVNVKREVNGITTEIPKIGEVGIFLANQSAWLS
jgi:hypothetical protein